MRFQGKKKLQSIGAAFVFVFAVIIAAIDFIKENPAIFIVIALIIIGIVAFFIYKKKMKQPQGEKIVFPKIEVSEEIDQYVKSLIEFVYADGTPPRDKTLSKENQYNILCQLFSMDIDVSKYQPFVQNIYENAVKKVNTYASITDKEEWYRHLHFAFESVTDVMIRIFLKKCTVRDGFKAFDNVSDRLLQMDEEKFKKLFFRLHEFHFWYVYNQDEDYKLAVKNYKDRLKFYHGIKQTDFYKRRSENKDDVSYVLYFAEKAGDIVRKEEGRTYRLYLPEDNPDEIKPFEYSSVAASETGYDYNFYWKDIAKELKKCEGILQTEFYSRFTWDSEIITRALREAEKDGKVLREKKGNTYTLSLPKEEKA